MPKVLISAKLSPKGVALLSAMEGMEVSEIAPVNGDELVEALKGYDACIVRSESKLPKEIIERCPDLKIIGRAGSGFDNIDAKFAREKDITVLNAPGGNTVTTAEHTLALMFSMARFVPQANSKLQGGNWDRSFKGVELTDKTLGVLGLGNIGAVVADRAQGLKMNVIGYDPVIDADKAKAMGVELLELEEVFKRADFLTIHTPMMEATKHIVGKQCFEVCKPGLRLVNCARGGLVDEAALLQALESGKVAAAALDVYESEPATPENPLVTHPNVVCTPHLGASTVDAQVKVAEIICTNVGNFLNGKDYIGLVN
ncbi:MAG: hydroxyacid dehydrogenase [Planctomycetota bacterium]